MINVLVVKNPNLTTERYKEENELRMAPAASVSCKYMYFLWGKGGGKEMGMKLYGLCSAFAPCFLASRYVQKLCNVVLLWLYCG